MDVLDLIIRYEAGELGESETLDLFSRLIESGMAWTLQGSYGRTATSLIDGGYIDRIGKVLVPCLPEEMVP